MAEVEKDVGAPASDRTVVDAITQKIRKADAGDSVGDLKFGCDQMSVSDRTGRCVVGKIKIKNTGGAPRLLTNEIVKMVDLEETVFVIGFAIECADQRNEAKIGLSFFTGVGVVARLTHLGIEQDGAYHGAEITANALSVIDENLSHTPKISAGGIGSR